MAAWQYTGGSTYYGPGSTAAGGGGAAGYSVPPGFETTTQTDPEFEKVLAEMWGRFKGDGGAGQAIDLAGGKIREAGEGARKAVAANATARGVSGTGADMKLYGNVEGTTQANIAGAAADIANQREIAKDSILSGIAGVAGNKAGIDFANRRLGYDIWSGQRADQRAMEGQQSAQQLAILQMILNNPDMGEGYGYYG